jgi:hypothetical protein
VPFPCLRALRYLRPDARRTERRPCVTGAVQVSAPHPPTPRVASAVEDPKPRPSLLHESRGTVWPEQATTTLSNEAAAPTLRPEMGQLPPAEVPGSVNMPSVGAWSIVGSHEGAGSAPAPWRRVTECGPNVPRETFWLRPRRVLGWTRLCPPARSSSITAERDNERCEDCPPPVRGEHQTAHCTAQLCSLTRRAVRLTTDTEVIPNSLRLPSRGRFHVRRCQPG